MHFLSEPIECAAASLHGRLRKQRRIGSPVPSRCTAEAFFERQHHRTASLSVKWSRGAWTEERLVPDPPQYAWLAELSTQAILGDPQDAI